MGDGRGIPNDCFLGMLMILNITHFSAKIHIHSLLAHKWIHSKSMLFQIGKKKKSRGMEWLVRAPKFNKTVKKFLLEEVNIRWMLPTKLVSYSPHELLYVFN